MLVPAFASTRVERHKALATIRVMRAVNRGDYAEMLFPRTMESARQVVLLPDDRVHWSQ